MPKYIKAEPGPRRTVIYTDSDGKKWEFSGGSRPWRNQNPGNLVPGNVSKRNGAIGKAGGFDEDAVEAIFALHQAAEDTDEIAAHAAADTAVVHFKKFFVALDNKLVVHADFAEFVFDHGEFFPVLFGKDAIE